MGGIRVVARDYIILKEIFRWRITTGKHIRQLAGFTGQRACDRRLAKLITAGFLERRKILYGFPSFYGITTKGKKLLGVPVKKEQIRVEQVPHDLAVLDAAVYFSRKRGIVYSDITTEKQLHMLDGFSSRKHRPDFIFTQDGKTYCVEIELTLKSKKRFENNVKENFENYDGQFWVVPDVQSKICRGLKEMSGQYPDIEILEREVIQLL